MVLRCCFFLLVVLVVFIFCLSVIKTNENETLKKQFEKFLDKTIENNEQLIAKCDNILDKI